MNGLYIHIPFCISKCAYCDFASYTCFNDKADTFFTQYIHALLKEAALYPSFKNPQTLYIGGGTPSILNIMQLNWLLNGLQDTYGPISNFKESTIECNPESLTEDKIKLFKNFGFTRLSLGMQTTNDAHLKAIGRAHSSAQFFKIYALAANHFNNINVDIIANLPTQTHGDFKVVLNDIIKLNPAHISVYGLQVEEGTKLYQSGYRADDELCLDMLKTAFSMLSAHGYTRYETSNYSKHAKESQHNLNYWDSGPYLGLGAAAASYLNGKRTQNQTEVEQYIKLINQSTKAIVFEEQLTGKALVGERVLLGLRKTNGIFITADISVNFATTIAQLCKDGLVQVDNNYLKLTAHGTYFANTAMRHFVEPF